PSFLARRQWISNMPERTQETLGAGRAGSHAVAAGGETGTIAELPRRAEIPGPARRVERETARPPVNIDATERTVSVAAGSLLALYGLRRRSWITRLPAAALGAALAYRGVTGRSKT